MRDLTKLTAGELLERFQDRIIVSLRNPEWHEIRRRLERLEQCEAAARRACNEWLLWRALQPSSLSPAMEELEALLADAARAALEE